MKLRAINIAVSILIAALFLWLAFRNIDVSDLWDQILTITYYWLPFFVITMVFSHFLRAERWRLLMPQEFQKIKRSTLFAGVMLGYVVNNIVPRLGEISRPVYVAKKGKVSTGNLVGTIVAERLFDLFIMLSLILFTVLLLVSDITQLQQVFGIENWRMQHYLLIPAIFIAIILGIWLFYKLIIWADDRIDIQNPVLSKIISSGISFGEGMISLKKVKNWPLFLMLTAGIWGGYIIMTYLPFYMMNMQQVFGLSMIDAVVLTVVSTIGVTIPTPAAIGSYHLFIQQTLWLLYDVPVTTALTYATVLHAVNVLFVFIIGPIALWWDKYETLTGQQSK